MLGSGSWVNELEPSAPEHRAAEALRKQRPLSHSAGALHRLQSSLQSGLACTPSQPLVSVALQ